MNEAIAQMEKDLISIDPSEASYFEQQYAVLNTSLSVYQDQVAQIKEQFAGVEVASTESIFEYLANATGLDLVSPTGFMEAVAEGNDPSAQDVITFEQQLESGRCRSGVQRTDSDASYQ